MDRKTLNTLYGLAMSDDWSTDDLWYRKCKASELALFAEMCIAAAYDKDGVCSLTDDQTKRIAGVGVEVGIPEDKCGRFFRRVCDIAERRQLSIKSLVEFWRGMQTEVQN